MASLVSYKTKPIVGRMVFLIWLLSLFDIDSSIASQLGVFDYRFREQPNVLIEPNETEVDELQIMLEYASTDKELLWDIARSLEPNTATTFLCDYLDQYYKENKLTDSTWCRGVFCLGMVQTNNAKDKLLSIWTEYDLALSTGRLKVDLSEQYKSIRPLLVIGDALHFYLWDNSVRQWFEKRIKELDSLQKPTELDLARTSRFTDRRKLITLLLTWDIIESVDEGPVITPNRVTAFHPFTQTNVKNISKAAEKTVDWAERMKRLNPEISIKEWKEIRKSAWEPIFDQVCGYLGKSLGMTIWKEYLHNFEKKLQNKHRVWFICLLTFLYTVDDTSERSWNPNDEEEMFLYDAIEYIKQLDGGFLRDIQLQTLYKISCFSPEDTDSKYIEEIRELSNKFLDESTRQGIISNVNLNLSLAK